MNDPKAIISTELKATYAVSCTCTHCDFSGEVRIRVGRDVSMTPCPKCECNTLKRVAKPTFFHTRGS
jgi:hypothetical protein